MKTPALLRVPRTVALSRRQFLARASLTAAGGLAAWDPLRVARSATAVPPLTLPKGVAAKVRPDLVGPDSPKGIEVLQLTVETNVPSAHVYMEAQVFTLDSKRFVLHRSAHAHGSDKNDPEHRYLLCDLEDGCSLHPLTEERGATGPAVSPNGQYLYYFVDQTEPGADRLTLKRVRLDGTQRKTIMVVDGPLPGSTFRPSRLYPLSTISSDGKRIAISAFLGDGNTEGAPFGLMVFDVERAQVNLVIHGPTWCNMHPQYSRSMETEHSRDILIQENHGNECTAKGQIKRLIGGEGADIHVIRDDGANFRNLPWGRDGNEYCQGHQCWRGRSAWAITSTSTRQPREAQLIEALPAPHADHLGSRTPGGRRNDLSREFKNPQFFHFATDLPGRRLISDAGPLDQRASIYDAQLGQPGTEPARNFRRLLCPRSSCIKTAHIHPFLSPDGRLGFFNSDESGILQAYMIRGLA